MILKMKQRNKYKVIQDYPTPYGVLYKDELVQYWDESSNIKEVRVKDNMGRIWNIPKKILIKTS